MSKKSFENKLKELANNKTYGSKELLEKLNHLFLVEIESINFSKNFINQLKTNFSSFTAIVNYLDNLNYILIQKHSVNELKNFLLDFKAKQEQIYNSLYQKLYHYLKANQQIITISNSYTVFQVLKLINKNLSIKELFVCESRPNFEGRLLAKRTANEGISTEIILEANLSYYVEKADLIIIGADTIFPNGNIVNKIGSRSLAIISKYFNKPFYVLGESSKISVENHFSEEEKNVDEIWDKLPSNIKCTNKYFEVVEKELITKLILE